MLAAVVAMAATVSALPGPVLFARDIDLAVRATNNGTRSEYPLVLILIIALTRDVR